MWVYLPIPPKEFPVGKRSIDWDFKKNGRDFESTVKAKTGRIRSVGDCSYSALKSGCWVIISTNHGHCIGSTPRTASPHCSAVRATNGSTGRAPNKRRIADSFLLRCPLAKKPSCRIRTKRSGRTCCRNRPTNWSAGNTACLRRLPSLRSR